MVSPLFPSLRGIRFSRYPPRVLRPRLHSATRAARRYIARVPPPRKALFASPYFAHILHALTVLLHYIQCSSDAHRPIDTDCRCWISLKALLNYLKQGISAPYSALSLIDLDLLLFFWTLCNATCGQIFIPIGAFTHICVSSACEATSSIYIC